MYTQEEIARRNKLNEADAKFKLLNAALDRVLDRIESPSFYTLPVNQQNALFAAMSKIGGEMDEIKW